MITPPIRNPIRNFNKVFDLGTVVPDPTTTVGSSIISEAVTNDGSITETQIVTLLNGVFDADMSTGVSVNNLPVGLGLSVARNSDTQITISFTGNATDHEDVNDVLNTTVVILAAKISTATEDITSDNVFKIDFDNAPPLPDYFPGSGTRELSLNYTPSGLTNYTLPPECLWSVYSDADNYMALWVNGTILYFEKKVSGISEYVTYYHTLQVGVSRTISSVLNSDDTLQLKVDGVPRAGSGYGAETINNGDFNGNIVGWAGTGPFGYSGTGQAYVGTAGTMFQSGARTAGRLHKFTGDITQYLAGGVMRISTSTPAVALWQNWEPGNAVGSHSCYNIAKSPLFTLSSTGGNFTYFDNISYKEVINDSTTVTPNIVPLIVFGSFNGGNNANGSFSNQQMIVT